MKPKDLSFFYKSGERKPEIRDNVFCVPRNYVGYDKFSMPDLQKVIFKNDNPIHVEFCSGNGEWIVKCAQLHPEINWIAVERKFSRVRKIWSKMKNHALDNLFIVCGNAEDFSEHYLPKGLVSSIYINFPDPWPKTRHAKNRLIQAPFVNLMAKISNVGATCIVVTDDKPYALQAIDEMQNSKMFKSAYQAPYFVDKPDEYGLSYFNRLWIEKGRDIHYIKYLRQA